jgi:CMP-N-acetylneuraminic acid synthetase
LKSLGKIIAQIPARAGSKRVKAKNLRLIAGEPLLSYSASAAVASSFIEDVYVNSDSAEMLSLGESLGAKKIST